MSSTEDQIANALAATGTAMEGAAEKVAQAKAENERLNNEAYRLSFDLLFVQGLYADADLVSPVGKRVETKLREGGFGFDAYCVNCKRETTFRVASKELPTRGMSSPRYGSAQANPPGLFAVHATCQRDWTVYSYILAAAGGRVTKIGQWPSLADIAFGELKSIDKSLDPIDRMELGKALGLFSHDFAIGAFAYLRRVFERMIARAYERKRGSR